MTFINTVEVVCPYCAQDIELVVDYSAGAEEYVEDCSVCCHPFVVTIEEGRDKEHSVHVRPENE